VSCFANYTTCPVLLAPRQGKLILPKAADHTFNRLDWQKQVIEATEKWFKQTL
jgi:hypothetical protein